MAKQAIGTEKVIVKNPKTGQVMEATIKTFHSLYRDKGFELVTRDNVETDGRADGQKKTRQPKGEPLSSTGSAADVAAALNLDAKNGPQDLTTPEDPASGSGTPNATLPADGDGKGPSDEKQIDVDDAATEERLSNRRDRGRSI